MFNFKNPLNLWAHGTGRPATKEEVYDQQIAPLMDQIISICQGKGIEMIATFSLPSPDDPTLACTSMMIDLDGDAPPAMKQIAKFLLPHTANRV